MASSNIVPLAMLGIGGAWWWNEQSKKKAKTTKASPTPGPSDASEEPQAPTGPPLEGPPLSPFVAGSNCTQLAETEVLEQWLEATATTAFLEVMATRGEGALETRAEVWDLVDAVWARATPPCLDSSSDAYAQAYKSTWCLVVTLLSVQGRIGEDTFDVLRSCDDPAFDPHRARPSRPMPTPDPDRGEDSEVPVEPTPTGPNLPPIPTPDPDPFPVPPGPLGNEEPPLPPPPLPDPVTGPPRNIESPTTRQGIAETSLLRLVAAGERQGTTRGRPSTVVLALDPEWEHAEQAIAGLEHYAASNPSLMFYVVSFWDSQAHFGLPELLGGLKYILSSADAEGIAARDPFIGNNTDIPIQPSQWDAVIGHALSGGPGLVGRPLAPVSRTAGIRPKPGRSLGATLLGLGPRPSPPPKRTPSTTRALSSTKIPYRRFASARLHRRLGA